MNGKKKSERRGMHGLGFWGKKKKKNTREREARVFWCVVVLETREREARVFCVVVVWGFCWERRVVGLGYVV